jgi:hypothetical protein
VWSFTRNLILQIIVNNEAISCQPNGLAHLPPVMARQQNPKSTFSTKMPLRTYAEGGQVEPMLGGQNNLLNNQSHADLVPKA